MLGFGFPDLSLCPGEDRMRLGQGHSSGARWRMALAFHYLCFEKEIDRFKLPVMNKPLREGKGARPLSSRRNRLEIVAHVVIWILFFTWPLLIFHTGETDQLRSYVRYLVYPVMAMGLFYLNYSVLIRKLLFPGKNWQFVAFNFVLIALAVLLIHLWRRELMDYLWGMPEPRHRKLPSFRITWFFALQNFLNLAMVVIFAVILRVVGRWHQTEMERQAIEQEKSLVELGNLKSQLHPHFLFNTLNNIYALITIDPEKAKVAVHDLGGLLRYVLKESVQEKVLLWDDVFFIRNYIDLMNLRIGGKTHLSVSLPEESLARKYFVPPLLFINLVENAFKYGVGTQESRIEIRLEVDQGSNRLHFLCRNSMVKNETRSLSMQDTGVGLKNLQKRLSYIYGSDHDFKAAPEGDEFVAELEIPLKQEA